MAMAQVRPQYAHLYPALARGHWYPVGQEAGDAGDPGTIRLEAGAELVEVAAGHVVRRQGAGMR
jgi:hypothetical protein